MSKGQGFESGWYMPGIVDPAKKLAELSPFEEAVALSGDDFSDLLERLVEGPESSCQFPSYVMDIPESITGFIDQHGIHLPEREKQMIVWGLSFAYYLGQNAIASKIERTSE